MSTLQDLSKVLSRKQAILDENAAGVEQQKKSGKQTARERIALLLDGGSFVEQSMLAQDAGVVAGSGTVDGRPVFVFAQDFAVMDGAMGAKQAKKIVKILEQARKTGTPVVAMCDSNGARVGEGAAALELGCELALSGHNHGGLIRLPWRGGLIAANRELFPEYTRGAYPMESGSYLVVSAGLAKVGQAPRLFNPLDVPVITLRCGASSDLT